MSYDVNLKKLTNQQTKYRDKKSETGIKWDDPDLNIKWPVKKPILSNKDKNNISLKEFLK